MPSKAARDSLRTKPGSGAASDASDLSLRKGLKEFTRQRLLDAALQCFRERGYQETTVDRVVQLAGTTVPTFYRHFPSKADLLYPLLDQLTQEVETTLRELDGLDIRERKVVRRWLDSYMVMWARVHKLCAAHWEATNVDPVYAERVMDDAINCVSVMESILSGMEAQASGRFKIRMGLIILFIDRMAFVVSHERSAKRARQILDEFGNILWLVLNDDPVLDY